MRQGINSCPWLLTFKLTIIARTHSNVNFEPIHIETYRKSSMPSYFRVFWSSLSGYRKPIKSRRGLGTVGRKDVIPGESRNSMPLDSGSFGRKPRFHVIVGLKGGIVTKTVVISKTPTSYNAKSALFLFGYFIQSILNKIKKPRTHCLIFDYY